MKRIEERKKVILVGVNTNQEDFNDQMEELSNLCSANNYEVVGSMSQNLNKIHSKYYLGKGKLEELTSLIEEKDVPIVIFNDELTPSQVRRIGEYVDCEIIDRTQLILDIFTSRARSKEAKIQTEIALIEYQLPRLIGDDSNLDRQRGGSVNNKGAGETKLESDRRRLRKRLKSLNTELKDIKTKRETTRRRRHKSDLPLVSLIGYTNAGKSTIMNALINSYMSNKKNVFEKDMVFATLDTSIRNIKLSDNKEFLLTDTVGFINKLPHQLINAFRSTLEEVANADLFLHVVDRSNPNYKDQIKTTEEVLETLGFKDVPTIIIYNKIDLLDEIPVVESDNTVCISAKYNHGIKRLTKLIDEQALYDYVRCEMLIPYENGDLINYLNEHANIVSTSYDYNGTKLCVECKHSDLSEYQDYII